MEKDQSYMQMALQQAQKAMSEDEVPIGAVIIKDNKIISTAYNKVETLQDPTAHAEIIAIREAAYNLGRWRLTDSTIYITAEPCCMCLGAIIFARISRLVYAANAPKTGFCSSQADLLKTAFSRFDISVESGIFAQEASDLMQVFFQRLRRGTEVWP